MLAKAPLAVFPGLTASTHVAHALHDGARDWPETNCYMDVWIEVLHVGGHDPGAALAFTVAQDFEGDHFTFAKVPLEDLRDLYGLEVTELALYDSLESHIVEQISRGRLVLVEVDGFFLPDTRGTSYRAEHTKTTIAINRLDAAHRQLDYFHGPGVFTLSGADYEGVLAMSRAADSLFPYAEFVKFGPRPPAVTLAAPRDRLARAIVRRPTANPVLAWRDRLREQASEAAARPADFIHKYAFNTARQLGMNFELLGSHLAWLGERAPELPIAAATAACAALSSGAKSFQFQLARAAARRRFDTLESNLDPLVMAYDRLARALTAL